MSKMDELRARYDKAMHGMQAGIQMKIQFQVASECEPKHLRVGINSAMVDTGAMAKLLVAKGVFTEEEYLESLVEFAEREHKMYEEELSVLLQKKITLV